MVTPGSTQMRLVRRGRSRGSRFIRETHDQHAVLDRQRAAGQARAGAARDPRHARLGARPHDAPDLLGGAREHRRGRDRVVLEQAVGLVGPQLVLRRCRPSRRRRSRAARRRARAGRARTRPPAARRRRLRDLLGLRLRRPSTRARPWIAGRTITHMIASSSRLHPSTLRNRSPSCPPSPTAAAPIARFCGEIILPSTPPDEFAAASSGGSSPASLAACTWSAPNSEFEDVSEPVTATPSQPMIDDRKRQHAAGAGDPGAERQRLRREGS